MKLHILRHASCATFCALLFSSSWVQAQQATHYSFECVVERTFDSQTFVPMKRTVVCPVTASFISSTISANRVGVAGVSAPPNLNLAGSCTIPPSKNSCTGKIRISEPIASWFRSGEIFFDRFATSQSLLIDDEVRQGAIAVSAEFPEVQTQYLTSDFKVIHRYAFPEPTNPFYNYDKPCDVNKDGFISAMDTLTIINFLRSNGGRVNLATFGNPKNDTGFYDVNNDWWTDYKDVRDATACVNRRSGS
jgi:hypothetical protein